MQINNSIEAVDDNNELKRIPESKLMSVDKLNLSGEKNGVSIEIIE